jgi:hypothetical protein
MKKQTYTFTKEELRVFLHETISMYREWRDIHGYPQKQAELRAINDMLDGQHSLLELRELWNIALNNKDTRVDL